MNRQVVIGVLALFTAFFAFLTLFDAVHNGVSFLTIVSLGVLVLFAIGIYGAITEKGDD